MESVTIEDVCKKDFEVFCDLWGYDKTIDENGFYSCSLTDRLFVSFCTGWQASRKALVVELPATVCRTNVFDIPWTDEVGMEHDEYFEVDDIRKALEDAGVGYK